MNPPFLIVGLGNPGDKYAATRHNVGSRVIDAYVAGEGAVFRAKRAASIAEITIGNRRFYAMKPHAFMNVSGDAVSVIVRFYKVPLDRLIVIHDDLDLEFGTIRTAFDRGDAGHQGVASVIASLGSKAFHRIRIGIGSNRTLGIPSEEYVLQNFSEDEDNEIVSHIIPAAIEQLQKLERDLLKTE